MREQIQATVNGLPTLPLIIRNAEVRQVILQHTLDRYDDLVASGKPEQEADEAVAGIGDVSGSTSINRQKTSGSTEVRGFSRRPPHPTRLRPHLQKRRNLKGHRAAARRWCCWRFRC